MNTLTASTASVKCCAASIVPTEAEHALGDRLAYSADGGDPDDYRPGWNQEPAPVAIEAEYFLVGLEIGSTGDNPHILAVFGHHTPATRLEGEVSFYRGLLEGRQAHAWQAGHALGLGGQHLERPDTVHHRFARQFEAGWRRGADAWADREAIQREWAAEVEADALERSIDEHNAEAGGWLTTGHPA